MNCRKMQKSIMTDYIDTQMTDKQKELVDQHLAHCHACKEFLRIIRKEAVSPFINVQRVVPDGFLWDRIKKTIEEEQQQQVEKSLIPDLWERLKSLVHIPRPTFALATVATLIFMVGITNQLTINSQSLKINGQAQVEYLSSLINEPVDTINDGNDLGTPIEKYFL